MKRFSLFLGLSFMLSLNFSVTAFAGVPPQCQDGRGNVRCDLKGCQQYCRDYGHRPGNNGHGHMNRPGPGNHHPAPVPPPPAVRPAPVPPPPAFRPAPVPLRPMTIEERIDQLVHQNDMLRDRLRHTFVPHERQKLEIEINRNDREIRELVAERNRRHHR